MYEWHRVSERVTVNSRRHLKKEKSLLCPGTSKQSKSTFLAIQKTRSPESYTINSVHYLVIFCNCQLNHIVSLFNVTAK